MGIALSFCFFVALMVTVGALASLRGRHRAEDYLMAGHAHGRVVIALSGAASAASGFVMIGAVGAGYTMGFLAVLMPVSWFIGDLIFWSIFPERLNRMARTAGANTVPGFVSRLATGQQHSALRRLLALISIVFVGLYGVGQLLAAGKAVGAVFEISLNTAVVVAAMIVLAYTAKGGLQSSIPTQFVQALIMLFTTVFMFLLALFMGGGPVQLYADLYNADPHLVTLDGGRGFWLLAVFLIGFAGAAFNFDIGQPHLLVRIMATSSPEEAARARWFYLLFMQLTWITMSLFGMMMRVLLPDLGDPEQALPLFAAQHLPAIMSGAVLAGIFASVASTLDAQILVLSSSMAVDLSPRMAEQMSARLGAWYQVLATVVVSVILVLATIVLIDFSSVFSMIVFSATALGVSVGVAVFVVVLGWPTSQLRLSLSVLAALSIAIVWRYSGLSDYMLSAVPGFVGGLGVHWLLGLLLNSSTVLPESPAMEQPPGEGGST